MASPIQYKIDQSDLPPAILDPNVTPYTFKYVLNNDVSSEVTVNTSVNEYKPLLIEFDNIEVEFGPGVHAIIGPAGSGKTGTVKRITDKLDASEFSLTTLAEPAFDSFYNIQDAFTHAFEKDIIFIDSLRIFMFESNKAATLAGGISAILPLLLSELTTFALKRNKVIFVAINTLDAKMYDSLLAVTEGSVTSVITPKVNIRKNGGVGFTSIIRSRYYRRQSFIARYGLDSISTDVAELQQPWYATSGEGEHSSACDTIKTSHGSIPMDPLC